MNTQRLVASVLASASVLPGNSTDMMTDYTFVQLHQAICGGQRVRVNAASQVALAVLAEENDPRSFRWSITDKEALSLGTAASQIYAHVR